MVLSDFNEMTPSARARNLRGESAFCRDLSDGTTPLGAAWLAGSRAGVCPGPAEFQRSWGLERRFEPQMGAAERRTRYERWTRAVTACLSMH